MKKRIIMIVLLSLLFIIIGIGCGYYFKKESIPDINVVFSFINELDKEKEYEVNTLDFIPSEVSVFIDNEDKSELLKVDTSNLDLKNIGEYVVKYYVIYNEKRYEQLQKIIVVDKTKPEIELDGKNITILINEKYEEPGYKAIDNYDGDITDKVKKEDDIDNTKEGTYKITYSVSDKSGNSTTVTREVIVKKPNVVVVAPKEEKIETPKVIPTQYVNTIKKNKFTNSNIYLEGYTENITENNVIKFVGEKTYEFALNMDGNNYTVNINPDEIVNGEYKIYINEDRLLNKMTIVERLARAKVGSKLVTFSYNSSDEVSIEIENHSYAYDILINPGHGGSDTGAVNEYIAEKEMNLTVSMYEKCRYEAHGLRVYMTRTNDVYSKDFGPSSLIRLHKLAYEMGYYGAVAKIVYSNHHNSIGNNYYSGYEILIAGALNKDEIGEELNIAAKWNNIFDLKENHIRVYARDYDTERIYSKLNGETYTFKDNYAVNRIPYQTANVKSIIFEGAYMSNKDDFIWYWQNGNWKNVSEAKIEVYINSLGLTYNPDTSSCDN